MSCNVEPISFGVMSYAMLSWSHVAGRLCSSGAYGTGHCGGEGLREGEGTILRAPPDTSGPHSVTDRGTKQTCTKTAPRTRAINRAVTKV